MRNLSWETLYKKLNALSDSRIFQKHVPLTYFMITDGINVQLTVFLYPSKDVGVETEVSSLSEPEGKGSFLSAWEWMTSLPVPPRPDVMKPV